MLIVNDIQLTKLTLLNCRVSPQGQLVGVMGRVGSGKSSLLSAIVGELHKSAGSVCVDDLDAGFALVGQEAWLQQATVRDNILFGRPYESQRYNTTLEACALLEDLRVRQTDISLV